ncbi:alpha/beta fold hydrolase [Kurthia huakuii]|uniref:alpha/beta fold hydrolase n=1 Tax=Kurthia huakuii TaxID=1421019 RepID=UPI0004955FE3|nr:alpha/beta hydrolase [Kurthia huakuii]MBM7699896.1 sigma-B regulation protein RsbQ [Kurthia huakuii]
MGVICSRNNVKVLGQGNQTLMFAHGFGCEQTMWQYITPAFESTYKMVLFDYVGAGQSDLNAYNATYRSADGYVQDVLNIIDELALKDVIFVGHSVSSMIGMLAAIERPEAFKKVIMIGPSPCYLNDGDYQGGFDEEDIQELLQTMEMNFTGWASYMAPFALSQDPESSTVQSLENVFVSQNPRIAREFADMTFHLDCRNRLAEMTVPSVILQCAEDSIVPGHVGHYLHEHLPHSSFEVLDVKGHYPHISHPEVTIERLKHYVKEG